MMRDGGRVCSTGYQDGEELPWGKEWQRGAFELGAAL